MKHTMRAGCGVEAVSSTKSKPKDKAQKSGGSSVKPVSRIYQTRKASGLLVRASASTPLDCPTFGLFISSRTPHDSSAPHPGGSEENGIGICESLSQRCNSEIIRLARRNHKPGGADLAGSVHVVRSLSG